MDMKTKVLIITLLVITGAFDLQAISTTRYVSPGGSNTAPYTTLATAATDIQTAVNACIAGDLVLVDNGTYVLTTNISVTIAITLRSINGAAVAIIDGNNVTRCMYINSTGALIEGFTIKNGKNLSGFGGGININTGGTVQNCIITNCQARDGGGVALDAGGLLQNCYIYGNLADNGSGSGYGGGVRLLNDGEVRNCEIVENSSVVYGGGVNIWEKGKVKNCVIAKNTAPFGAGIRTRNNSSIYNCIIYYNTGNNYEVSGSGYYYYNCCTTPALSGTYSSGCISAVPMYVSTTPGSEDYHLQAGSPCIDVGYNLGWMTTVPDLDGNPRIVNLIVDMGPYEYAVPAPVDTDGDGIPDVSDDYPADPERAFNNYFPAPGFGTLAYEDLWPAKGDYDFNDLVIDYRFKTVTNASNKVVEIFGTFTVKAFGAAYRNGFGFQLYDDAVNQSHLSVTGYHLTHGIVTLGANGLETGQARPTVIVYDDAYDLMPHPGSGIGVNTTPGAPYVAPYTLNIYILFNTRIYTMTQVDIEHFNPFIFVNHQRGLEVHLPDRPPTGKANPVWFGTIDDNSNPGLSRYYKTVNNLPWAINIYESFDYPVEKVQITNAYNHFVEWAESGGALYPDWYRDLPGYRNAYNIY